jgi:membrane fusion protein (multidrug efflux system)
MSRQGFVPDDFGYRQRIAPDADRDSEPLDLTRLYEPEEADRAARPPRDLTALYEGEEIPQPHRTPPRRHDRDDGDDAGREPEDAKEGEEKAEKEPEETPEQKARGKRKRLIIAAVVGALLLIAAIGFGVYWFTTLRWFESTDDAYTQADNTIIAPKVAGYVSQLLVTDNQIVKTGDPLLRIDPRDYQATVDQAQADVASAQAGIKNIDAQITMQQSNIEQARTDITSAEANLVFSRQEYARYQALVQTGAGTIQRMQQAESDLRDKSAAVQRAHAALQSATQQLEVLRTQRGQADATLAHNRAVLEQAKLNLDYTLLVSPIDGAVGNRTVQLGQYVQPGTQLMTIVPMGSRIYVVANFKETQLEHMYRGEHVALTIDTFPGITLHGKIDSLAPGSGAQFALLPPENATGNFTKIVQRVPVKILIDSDNDPVIRRLRPGLSVTADVDTRTAPPGNPETLLPHGAQ